jgi:hypothetical protein
LDRKLSFKSLTDRFGAYQPSQNQGKLLKQYQPGSHKPGMTSLYKVIYRAQDGGVVSDEATAITVPEVTEASTLLALSLAEERFNGKPVVVEGSNEFKLLVAKLSAIKGLSLRFADPVLEKDRQRHVRVKELKQERPTHPTTLTTPLQQC